MFLVFSQNQTVARNAHMFILFATCLVQHVSIECPRNGLTHQETVHFDWPLSHCWLSQVYRDHVTVKLRVLTRACAPDGALERVPVTVVQTRSGHVVQCEVRRVVHVVQHRRLVEGGETTVES